MKFSLSESENMQIAMDQFEKTIGGVNFVKKTEFRKFRSGESGGFADFYALLHISDYKKPVEFGVVVKSNGEKRFARKFMAEASARGEKDCLVFMAPYISPETEELLKHSGFGFMDFSGNCFVCGKGVCISVFGNANKHIRKKEKKNYLSKSSSGVSAVLRKMLSVPEKWWQVKELAEESGKAIGTVSNVKSFLADHEWIEEENGLFRICHLMELMKAWAKDYHEKKALSYQFYSLDSIPEAEKRISEWSKSHDSAALLGSFAAGVRYAPAVRYSKVNVYVQPRFFSAFQDDLDLRKVESGGNIIVTIPHDETIYLDSRFVKGDFIVSPVQAILDLYGESGRGEEAAEAVILKEYGDLK